MKTVTEMSFVAGFSMNLFKLYACFRCITNKGRIHNVIPSECACHKLHDTDFYCSVCVKSSDKFDLKHSQSTIPMSLSNVQKSSMCQSKCHASQIDSSSLATFQGIGMDMCRPACYFYE